MLALGGMCKKLITSTVILTSSCILAEEEENRGVRQADAIHVGF